MKINTQKTLSLHKVVYQLLASQWIAGSIIITLVVLGSSYLNGKNLIENQQQATTLLSNSVGNYVDSTVYALQALAASTPTQHDLDIAERVEKNLDALYLIDSNGRLLATSPIDKQLKPGMDMSGHPSFVEGTKDIIFSKPFISQKTDNPTVYISVPVQQSGDLLVGELSLARLQENIAGLAFSSRVAFYITDANGIFLIHPNYEMVRQQEFTSQLGIISQSRNRQPQQIFTDPETWMVGVIVEVPQTGWLAITQTPYSSVYGAFLIPALLGILLTAILYLLVVRREQAAMTRQVIDPMSELSRVAQSLVVGDFASEVTLSLPLAYSEVASLVESYESMRQAVQSRTQALSKSELKYRSLIESSSDTIFCVDEKGEYQFTNHIFASTFGKTPEYFIGKSFWDIYPKEHADFRYEVTKRVFQTGESESVEVDVPLEDKTLYFYATANPIKDDKGKVILSLTHATDITERKQTEIERGALLEIMQGLAETRDLQEILRIIHHCVARVMYAENFFAVFYNKATEYFEEVYAVDQYDPPAPPSRLAKSITAYVHRTGKPHIVTQMLFDELQAQGEVELVGTNSASWLGAPLNTPDGTIGVIVVQDYQTPDRYSESNKEFLMNVSSQVALSIERNLVEEALQVSEEKHRLLIENSHDIIYSLTAEGVFTYVSPAWTTLLGHPVSEVVGQSFQQFVHADDIPGCMAWLQKVIETGERQKGVEYRVQHSDGSWYWHTSSAFPLKDAAGTTIGFEGTARDITERKMAEELAAQQTKQLSVLYEASQRLYKTLNLDEIYQAICDFISISAPNDGVTISAYDPESQLITCRAYWMENKWLDVSSFPSIPLEEEGKGTQSIAIRTGKAMLVNDYQAQQKTAKTIYYVNSETNAVTKEVSPDEGITRSALIVPLETGELVTGVIQVMSYHQNAYTEAQLHLLEALALPIASAEENARLYAQVQIELNERKQAEAARRDSEEQFRIIFEKSSVGFTLTSVDGFYRKVNLSFAAMLGYTIEEIIGKNWADVSDPDDIQANHANIHAILAGEQDSTVFEKRYLSKNGSSVTALVSTTLLRDAKNAPLFFITNILDISERKQIEEALRNSENRFSLFMDYLPIIVFIKDAESRTLFVNKYMDDAVGASSWLGKTMLEIMPNALGEQLIADDRQTIKLGYQKIEESINHLDGKLHNYETQKFIIRGDGQEPLIGGISVDITERKQAEEIIQANQIELQRLLAEMERSRHSLLGVVEDQKEAEEQVHLLNAELDQRVKDRTAQLEAVNQELEAFSYSVSHDLRAPLRALDGFSAALITEYQEKFDEQGKHYLSRIQEASQRMAQLIEDLLNLSRITRREVKLSRVDLSAIAHQIAEDLQSQTPDRKVKFDISSDIIVRADPNLMKIVLENLMNNAIKFTGQREVAQIQLGETQQAGERVFYVRDNGAGFNMTYANKLFTPFQRLHATHEFTGTGIGLTIVQRIITRHGGRIWPEATVNQGATFYFTLEGE